MSDAMSSSSQRQSCDGARGEAGERMISAHAISRLARARRRGTDALRVAAVALGCVVGLASCGSSSSSTSALSASRLVQPSCAWPSVVGVQTFNKGVPDPMAHYWDQPIVTGASTRIAISGTYPDARYFTLSVYTPYGAPVTRDGLGSSLTDYQVAPEPGSVNPWQHRASAGGRYQVTVKPTATPGQANVLPLPAGTSGAHPGYLIYRVYVPASGSFSSVRPPTITLTQGKVSHTLPACRTHSPIALPPRAPATTASTSPTSAATAPPPPGAFYGMPATEYIAGLADANTAYAEAYIIRPPADDVTVVTAKAPTFPPGNAPSPWPQAGVDMRYWSMCIFLADRGAPIVANTLPNGQTDYGCRDDYQTRLADGDYAYVIGTEAQKAAISRVPGATFLPLPTTQTPRLYFLMLRNKLISPSFTRAAQNITQATDPSAASAAMGPYYPRVSTCPLSTLASGGVAACTSSHRQR
jgi:hypothetical protein